MTVFPGGAIVLALVVVTGAVFPGFGIVTFKDVIGRRNLIDFLVAFVFGRHTNRLLLLIVISPGI